MAMSILAIDIGAKRSGLCVSTSGILSTPLPVIEGAYDLQLTALWKIIDEYSIDTLVVGESNQKDHPINVFLKMIQEKINSENMSIKIIRVDEFLTTKEAERRLFETNNTKDNSDSIAAQIILEDYLAGLGTNHAQ
jgi:putative transcription antitermination factor YqgF